MTDQPDNDPTLIFVIAGVQICETCKDTFDPASEEVVYVFDVECPEHGETQQVCFHDSCLPLEYRQAYESFERARKAHLN